MILVPGRSKNAADKRPYKIYMKKAFVHELGAILDNAPDLLRIIPEDVFSAPVAPGKWSPKQELGHLIDSALNNIQRFVRGQYETEPHVVYNPDAWVEAMDYAHADSHAIISQWETINRRLLGIVMHMPEEHLDNLVNTGKNEPELHTINWLIDDYLVHLQHHLKHILE